MAGVLLGVDDQAERSVCERAHPHGSCAQIRARVVGARNAGVGEAESGEAAAAEECDLGAGGRAEDMAWQLLASMRAAESRCDALPASAHEVHVPRISPMDSMGRATRSCRGARGDGIQTADCQSHEQTPVGMGASGRW